MKNCVQLHALGTLMLRVFTISKTLPLIYEAGPTGIEPAAYGLRVRRSGLTELRARTNLFEKELSSTNIDVSLDSDLALNIWDAK